MHAQRNRRSNHGQGMMEYALILTLIALIVLALVSILGHKTRDALCKVSQGLGGQCSIYFTTGSNTVVPMSLIDQSLGSPITVGAGPGGIYLNHKHTVAYAINHGTNTMSVINTASNSVTATYTVGSNPIWLAINADDSIGYVTNWTPTNTVTVIDLNTGGTIATISTGATLDWGVVISPDGRWVYSVDTGSHMTIISTASNSVTGSLDLTAACNGALVPVFTPDGNRIYMVTVSGKVCAASGGGTPAMLLPGSLGASAITVGTNSQRIVITPDGSKLYVPNWGSNSVSVISTASNTVTKTISPWPAGSTSPAYPGLSVDGATLWMGDLSGTTITPISTATDTVGTPISVGTVPKGMAVL